MSELSRLGRSTVEVLQIAGKLMQVGVSIYVLNFGIKTLRQGKRNPVAQFVFTLLAEFARLKRQTLRERVVSGLDEARAAGQKDWSPHQYQGEASSFFSQVRRRD